MGLVEIVLMGLCLNSSCPATEDSHYNVANDRKMALKDLAKEIKGQHFTVATIQNYPLNYAVSENGTWVGKGPAFKFLNYLQKKYEFNYTLIIPKESVLGDEESGIFGLLYGGKADIAAALLPVMVEGRTYVRYSTNLDKGQWVILLRRPKESAQGSGLLAPFTWEVWLLILLSLVVVGPIIFLLIMIRHKLCKDDLKPYNLPSCIWFVYGALLKQGSTLSPTVDSTRMLFATWWLFITILTAFYTANLTAFLTLSQFTLPVNNPEDITTKKYNWIAKKGGAIEEAVMNVEEELYFMRQSNGLFLQDNDTDILDYWVSKKNYLFLHEKPTVDHLMYQDYLEKARRGIEESSRCTFVLTTWAILDRPRAMAYSKSFKWYEVFDYALQHMVESGIVQHDINEGLPSNPVCPLNLASTERQLRNSDLFLTYVVIAIGFSAATVVFVTELLLRYWKHCRKQLSHLVHVKHVMDIDNTFNYDMPPPPSYQTLFGKPHTGDNEICKKKVINGREYWVIETEDGEKRLVPVRSPSALLFQQGSFDSKYWNGKHYYNKRISGDAQIIPIDQPASLVFQYAQ